MAENLEHYNRHSTGPYSTLEAVQHHPELVPSTSPAPTYSTLEVSPKIDQGRFSTLPKAPYTADKGRFSAYGSSPPTSPKFEEGRFSTLEPYQHPDEPNTPGKTEGGLGAGGAESEPKKENWKRKRVCGIPLLFLVIGLVVVLAAIGAIVGGVVGSQKKNDPKPEPSTTTALGPVPSERPNNTKKVSNQTSNLYFNNTEYYPILYHFIIDVDGQERKLEDSLAHGRTPDDGVFLGPTINNGYQQWELAFVSPETKPSIPVPNKAVFWLRLVDTDQVLQIDREVWKTIFETKTDSERKDIPLLVKPFDHRSKDQMWYLGEPDSVLVKDSVLNVNMWTANWTMGIGPDDTAAMILNAPDKGKIWRLFNLSPLPPA